MDPETNSDKINSPFGLLRRHDDAVIKLANSNLRWRHGRVAETKILAISATEVFPTKIRPKILAISATGLIPKILAISATGGVLLNAVITSTANGQSLLAQAAAPAAEAKAATEVSGFWAIVFSGGWVGVLIVLTILILSLLAAYLIIEQLMTLRKAEIMPSGLADEVRQLLAQGRLADADAACRKRPSPLAFVLISGLAEIDFGWQAMEKAMEDAVAEQAAKLYRKIEYLSVIGNLAPMCGLLGTVTGMIMAFQQVAVTQGTAGAAQLAEGIYSALVTTVAGLVVAIPSLGAFAVFRNRVDQLISETAYLAQHVFVPVRRRASTVAPRATAPMPPPSPPRAQG